MGKITHLGEASNWRAIRCAQAFAGEHARLASSLQ
jgi:hypothetical protein